MNLGALNGYAVNGSSLDSTVRSSITGYCYAVCAPKTTYRPPQPTWVMEAQATIFPRVMSRMAGLYQASAESTPFGRCMYRSVVSCVAQAVASPVAHYVQTREWRSPIYGEALASASPVGRKIQTQYCYANGVVLGHRALRSPMSGTCEAVGYINSSDPVRYKFDYPSDIRIVVPYVNNQFTVR